MAIFFLPILAAHCRPGIWVSGAVEALLYSQHSHCSARHGKRSKLCKRNNVQVIEEIYIRGQMSEDFSHLCQTMRIMVNNERS